MIKLLALVVTLAMLTGCSTYQVKETPPLHIPRNLMHVVTAPSTHVHTPREMQEYLIDTINSCIAQGEILDEYQKKSNKLAAL